MAEIITQITFADYGMIEILGDLERFLLALLGMNDEALMLRLEARRGNRRDDYPVWVMWNLLIAMKVFEYRTIASFRRELARNSQMRKICGGLEAFGRKKHLVPPAPEMIKTVKGTGIIPIIDIRNCWNDGETTKQYKDSDMVYDFIWNVFMVDDKGEQHRMHCEGYDCQKNCCGAPEAW